MRVGEKMWIVVDGAAVGALHAGALEAGAADAARAAVDAVDRGVGCDWAGVAQADREWSLSVWL